MTITKRVTIITFAVTLLLTILMLTTIFQYTSSVQKTSAYVEHTLPAKQSIEHLRNTIYNDFIIIEQYLLEDNYSKLTSYDIELAHAQETCEILTDQVDELILTNTITNQAAIDSYNTALVIYGSWQQSRDTLLREHRTAAIDGTMYNSSLEHRRFLDLMQSSLTEFENSLAAFDNEQVVLFKQMEQRRNITIILLVIILLCFTIIATASSNILIKKIIYPLQQLAETSRKFTKGDLSVRSPEQSHITEIRALQEQTNRVYESIAQKEDLKQTKSTLLPEQYKQILDCISHAHEKGILPTVKYIKKECELTHPTASTRLEFLERNGYIRTKREGRNKFLYEV